VERDPLKKPATRQRLWYLFDEGILPNSAWGRAQQIAGYIPTKSEWIGFVDRLLLILGVLSVVAGVFFFFAFNWADMPRLAQFALVQGTVVVAAIVAFVAGLQTWVGRVSLLAAALLVGTSLGVVGQAYQTGADSWRLFQVWALLISGWVLISRWNATYTLWMVLITTTIGLYWDQVVNTDWNTLELILIGVNLAFVLLWDITARFSRFDFMQERWHLYLFAIPVVSYTTSFVIELIFDFSYRNNVPFYAIPLYIGVIGGLLAFYTLFKKDLAMIAINLLSVLVVLVCGIGRGLWESVVASNNLALAGYGYFFVMGVITVMLTAGLTYMLRQLQRRWEVA